MDLVFEQNATEIRFVSHSFHCRAFNFYHDSVLAFAIRDGALVINGTRVGTITENEVRIQFASEEGGPNEIVVRLDGDDKLVYSEHIDWGSGHTLDVEGAFARSPLTVTR